MPNDPSLNPEPSLEGEQCQQVGCGLLWPLGTLSAIDVRLANGHTKRIRVCPTCLSTFVDRMEMAVEKVCGKCGNFTPTGPSVEGDMMGGCAIYKRPMLADDPFCEHFTPNLMGM